MRSAWLTAAACCAAAGCLAAQTADAARQVSHLPDHKASHAVPAPAGRDQPPRRDQLKAAEQARELHLKTERDSVERARAASIQAQALAAQRVEAASHLRTVERAAGDAAARIAGLAAQERAAETLLAARARDFAPMLPLAERLSLYPAETLLAVPLPPEQAVRGILVLGGLSRQIESDAADLRRQQHELRDLRAQLQAELPAYAAARTEQSRQAAALDARIAAARGTEAQARDLASVEAQRAADAASQADSLRTALARLEADRQAAAAQARDAADRAVRQRKPDVARSERARQEALSRPAGPGLSGGGTSPVAGTVARNFGEPGDGGPAQGMAFHAAPDARVVAPCGGKIVFAGPFRSYGNLLIVDCGGGYHFVLAGLQRLDAAAGHPVQAGEPVGVMPGWDPKALSGRPSLYVELRQNGQAVNPAPFLRAKG